MRYLRVFILCSLLPGLSLAASHHHHSKKAHHAKKNAVKMVVYRNPDMHVKMAVPSEWNKLASQHAIGFRSPYGQNKEHAALGIMKSSNPHLGPEQAVRKEFMAEGKPAAWHSNVTRIGGHKAIRVITRNKADPDMKRLDYYVAGPHGLMIIQCMAPRDKWAHYSPVFTSMLTSLRFLQ